MEERKPPELGALGAMLEKLISIGYLLALLEIPIGETHHIPPRDKQFSQVTEYLGLRIPMIPGVIGEQVMDYKSTV